MERGNECGGASGGINMPRQLERGRRQHSALSTIESSCSAMMLSAMALIWKHRPQKRQGSWTMYPIINM